MIFILHHFFNRIKVSFWKIFNVFFNIIQSLKYNKFISFPTISSINCNKQNAIHSISNSIRVIKTWRTGKKKIEINFKKRGPKDAAKERKNFRAFAFAIPHAHKFDFSFLSFRFFFALRLLKKTLKNEQDDDRDYDAMDNSDRTRRKMTMMSK